VDIADHIARMARTASVIQKIVENISDEQARWKPDPESWSILEVINHLFDEEREDFRVRLDHILHKPDQAWPKIDPGGWVTSRRYNQRDLMKSLHGFIDERHESLRWLEGLSSPDWDSEGVAPWGTVRAGDMFAAWVAHDLLHLRQLVELQWAYTNRELKPFETIYAGEW
jgi:hypothetical protein